MNNLDVTKFGVQELDAKEMVEIEGGRVNPRKIWNAVEKVFTVIGVYDAISDFKEGWNSVECGCK